MECKDTMKNPKVLVADDDPHVRQALKTRLNAWGFRVLEVRDGLGVISLASRENVVAMILDHEMPNGSGRDVAWMIRRECESPIIFLSGHDRESFRQIVSALPDVYYLHKPLDTAKLHTVLHEVLSTRETALACA